MCAIPQAVRFRNSTSTLSLNTRAPHGCVLNPLMYSLFTHACMANSIKFADDTMVVGLITNNDESTYREEVSELALWCHDNNLSQHVSKTKELIVDFRKQRSEHTPIHINGIAVEFKFLCVQITEDLSWTNNTTTLVKREQQESLLPKAAEEIRHANPGPLQILPLHHREHLDRLQHGLVREFLSVHNHKALQRVVKTAQYLTGTTLLSIQDI